MKKIKRKAAGWHGQAPWEFARGGFRNRVKQSQREKGVETVNPSGKKKGI